MADYDGSIRIGVKIELAEAKKQLEHLRNRLSEQVKAIDDQTKAVQKLKDQYNRLSESNPLEKNAKAIEKTTAEFEAARQEAARLEHEYQNLLDVKNRLGGTASPKLQADLDNMFNRMVKAGEEAERVKAKLHELKMDPTATEEARSLRDSISEAEAALEQLKQGSQEATAQITQAEATVQAASAALQSLRDKATVADQGIIDLRNELEELNQRKADLEAAGVGLGFEEYDSTLARIQEINRELKNYQGNLDAVSDVEPQSWPDKLREAVSRMAAVIREKVSSSGSAIGTLKKRIAGLVRERGFDKVGKSAERFGRRLKSIVAGALFFNIISRGLTALTQQIGKYLTANRDFSAALSGIKSNLLTAFQPVYEAVLPALTAMMQAVESATARLAAFMASIFGTTASKAQENAEALYEQAHATEATGAAAKKAQKQQEKFLASFDTIEKLGSKETEETSPTAPAFDTDYSEVKPPQWMLDFWAPIKESWEQVGMTTVETAKAALGSLWDVVKAIGRTFLDLWNSAAGVEVLNNFQLLLQTILGIIHDIASAFMTAWNSGTGEQVIQALLFMLDSVFQLLISIGQSFREAWNDGGRGVTICNTILEIIRNIFEIVGNLAERFREAWEANDNGVAIWGAILDVFSIILQTIERITKATADWAKEINFEPLMNGIREALEAFVPLAQTIGDMVSKFWKDTVLPFLGWLIEDALPQVLEKLAQLFTYLAENPQVIANITRMVVAFFAVWEFASILNGIAGIIKHFTILGSAIIKLAGLAGSGITSIVGLLKGPLLAGIKAVIVAMNAHPVVAAISAITLAVGLLIANWETVKTTVENVISAIVSAVQSAIQVVQDFFAALGGGSKAVSGSAVGNTASRSIPYRMAYSGDLSAYNLDIPHLAKGAVISPNSEFLAILGDQKSGTNIEAPVSLLEDLLEKVVNSTNRRDGGVCNVSLSIDGKTFARVAFPYLEGENIRRGVNLIQGR